MHTRIPTSPLDWDTLRLFLAATRARSLTGAARALGLDQSTASRRLAALEKSLGVRLFDRVPGGLELTPTGQEVLPVAEAAEAQVLEFVRTSAGADVALKGTVRVAVPEAIDSELLVPELGRFYERYPQVVLEVVASPFLANLARREADLALRFVRPEGGEWVALKAANLESGVWGTRALVARGVAKAPWVTWDEASAQGEEARWMARHIPVANVRLRTNRVEALVAAAREGLGLAILPDALARRAGGLARLEQPHALPAAALWLVGHPSLLKVPRVRAVWDWVLETSKRLLA